MGEGEVVKTCCSVDGGAASKVVTEKPEFCPAIGRLIGVVGGGACGGFGPDGGIGRDKTCPEGKMRVRAPRSRNGLSEMRCVMCGINDLLLRIL